jgi:hypothetical protein
MSSHQESPGGGQGVSSEMPLNTGVCEQCGMGVHLDVDGRTSCDGCDMPTDRCQCAPRKN